MLGIIPNHLLFHEKTQPLPSTLTASALLLKTEQMHSPEQRG